MAVAEYTTISDLFNYALAQTKAEYPLPTPAVQWISDNYIDPVTKRLIKLEDYQRRILRHALQMDHNGYSRYNMVVWSQPKKSGKTAVAGAVGAWVACEVENPNEISCVANNLEQGTGRIFAAMVPTLESLGWTVPQSPTGTMAYGTNGSVAKAITTNYKGAAGGNQGISLWSELWAYSGERLQRLWEEMTPPPTRRFRMRWVETYAGFRSESLLLYSLYKRIFADDAEKTLNPGVVKLWHDLPVYGLEDDRMIIFWDHSARMPWQTLEYYQSQAVQLRNNAFLRLHKNQWVDSDESFISIDMWNNSCRREGPLPVKATYAIDGSKNSDCTALVGSVKEGEVVHTTDVRIWEPHGQEVDQNDVMRVILELHQNGLLQPPLYYDPYQLVKLAQDLRLKGVKCEEFSQGAERVKADTFLYKMYKTGAIVNWAHPQLRQHVLAASAVKVGRDDEEYRIIKPVEAEDEEHRKVDACVAQSMSTFKAYTRKDSGGGWAMSGR